MSTNIRVKVVLTGNTGVGKSSILHRFYQDSVLKAYPTIGASFMRKAETRDGRTVDIELWDTAGQERYKSLSSFYFRNVSYCILVFDVTNYHSFTQMNQWKVMCDNVNPEVTYLLVGNKIDLGSKSISKAEIDKYCQENNIPVYVETSAQNGEGISILYKSLVHQVFLNLKDFVYNPQVLTEEKSSCSCYK